MSSQTITIPAREVRPGDVLLGMTVRHSEESTYDGLWYIPTDDMPLWLEPSSRVIVKRPVPPDPIGTVRADYNGTDFPVLVHIKVDENMWESSGSQTIRTDVDVDAFPILWEPGMTIANTEVTA